MAQVHMQQKIDGEVRDLFCHPAAVGEWKKSGWEVADATPAPDDPKPLGRGAASKQES